VPEGCYACRVDASAVVPPRESVWRNDRWRVAHAFDSALPGWLVLLPRRHVTGAHELTAEEARELGTLLQTGSRALVEVTGCAKTYVMLFAEREEFGHLHVHLVPRAPDLPGDLSGPRIFGYLGRSPADAVPVEVMDALAARLGPLISAS
jgi:diadenosine tetraphosphate (Ap4A) HIT family hydrolase